MTSYVPSQCRACARYTRESRCEAYPQGIPRQIVIGGADHRQPFEGDHGLRFELRLDRAKELAEWEQVFGARG